MSSAHARRIIARLDVKGPNVVKGVQFEALRVMGKPADMAEEYYLQGADELIYLDVVASLYRRDSLLHIVREASKRIFIPFTAGGGVRSLDDIHELLHAGAEKVAINTAAIARPELIKEAAERFGKQCIVVSIEAKKKNGSWEAYTDNGRQSTGLDAIKWAKHAEKLGAGEILLTSVDQEGTERGLDCELIKKVSNAVTIPVIASGGASSEEDITKSLSESTAAGVAVGSLLHYQKTTVSQIKDSLIKAVVPTRPPSQTERARTTTHADDDLADYNRFTLRQLRDESYGIDPRPKTDVLESVPEGAGDVSIVDYGINNIRSVFRTIEHIGKKPTIADTREKILAAKRLILPGVGAFAEGMRALRARGLDAAIIEKTETGTPLFGICLGLQILFDESEEFGNHKGLGLVPGQIISFPDPKTLQVPGYTLPNIGWCPISPGAVSWESSALRSVERDTFVYFVHSYYPVPTDPNVTLAQSAYGGTTFCAAIQYKNITATQFHAEKSGDAGLAMLKEFCEMS